MNDIKQKPDSKFGIKEIMHVILIASLSVLLSMFVSVLIPVSPASKGTIEVYITYGTGLKKISTMINSAGLIRNRIVFQIVSFITGANKHFKAGEYEFSLSDSAVVVIYKLIKGDVKKYKVVIPEGSDIYDVDNIVASAGMIQSGEIQKAAFDPVFLKNNGIIKYSAEGFLFPDTYYLIRGETPEKIATTMIERYKSKSLIDVNRSYRIQNYNMTGYKVLIMASIIEKESRLNTERFLVSSVFYNRLKSPEAYQKRLESCATVRYALNKKRGIITYKDIKTDNPYNTYIRIGMPPGPICNPGAASMAAALNPAVTKYRYFVLFENGGHTFSETLEQHNKAKFANRKIRQEQE